MDHVVAAVRTAAKYGTLDSPQPAPELPGGLATTVSTAALRQILRLLQLDAVNYGTNRWNPLGALVQPGARIVLKPNFVIHFNQSGYGLDCLLTHPSVIEAVLEYVALTKPASVILGETSASRT